MDDEIDALLRFLHFRYFLPLLSRRIVPLFLRAFCFNEEEENVDEFKTEPEAVDDI